MASMEAIAVVAAFALMALMNWLAMNKTFGGKDNKEISDSHPTYVSPDGPTFAIWGMIYLLELVLVVVQAMPSERTEQLLSQRCPWTGLDVRQRLICAFLANGVWLLVFNNEKFWAGLAIMAAYLALLVSVYSDLNVGATRTSFEAVTLTAGVAMNTSWILVAFILSLFFCAGTAGWQDEHGVAGSPSAAAVVVVLVAVLGCWRAIAGHDLAWAFAAAWALRGIFRMQTVPDKVRFPLSAMNAMLGGLAQYCSLAVAAVMLISAARMILPRVTSVKAD